MPDYLWLNRRECDCRVAFRKDGHLDSVECGGGCAPPSLQLGLALTAQAEPPATKATTTSNEDNYLAAIPERELEERATEERTCGDRDRTPAVPSREQWETVDFPVRRTFEEGEQR